jgi:hypothetical protein
MRMIDVITWNLVLAWTGLFRLTVPWQKVGGLFA